MKVKATAVLMVVAMTAAGSAAAAQSSKATPARKAAIEKIVGNHRHFVQPHTMAEAARTEVRAPDGTVSVAVPEELWNNLSVSKDAEGKLHMHEADGAAPTAVASPEAPANE